MKHKELREEENKKTPEIEKIEEVGILARMIGVIREWTASSGKAVAFINSPRAAMLPESVGYALKYRDGLLGEEEVQSMLREDFLGAGVYLAFKLVDKDEDTQEKLLYLLCESVNDRQGYEKIYEDFSNLLTNRMYSGKFEARKVAKFFTQGLDLYEERFSEIADQIYTGNDVPVMLSYAAFLGLKPFLEKMPIGGEMVLLDAKKLHAGKLECGFIVMRNERRFEVVRLNTLFDLSSRFEGRKVFLVDDTKSTGASLAEAKDLFEGQESWPKIDGERVVKELDEKFVKGFIYLD